MPELESTLWRDIMTYLRQRHAPICRQWFQELKPAELNGGLLQIQTSNTIQQNYLQKKCLDQFTEAAQNATGALVAVRFTSEPEFEPDLPKDDPRPVLAQQADTATLTAAPPLPHVWQSWTTC